MLTASTINEIKQSEVKDVPAVTWAGGQLILGVSKDLTKEAMFQLKTVSGEEKPCSIWGQNVSGEKLASEAAMKQE